jgi:hypothetical protein
LSQIFIHFYSMTVPGVTAHACRIWIDEGPRGSHDGGQQPGTAVNETQPAVQRLLTSRPDYLITGVSGPTFRGGVEGNRKWKDQMNEYNASLQVAEKVGATREGVLRSRLVAQNKVHDVVMFSLVRQDYAS